MFFNILVFDGGMVSFFFSLLIFYFLFVLCVNYVEQGIIFEFLGVDILFFFWGFEVFRINLDVICKVYEEYVQGGVDLVEIVMYVFSYFSCF